MDEQMKSYFGYWGKAKKDPEQSGPDYHLLAAGRKTGQQRCNRSPHDAAQSAQKSISVVWWLSCSPLPHR